MIHRDPQSGHATTSTAHARVRLVAYVRTKPPSVLIESGSLEHEPFDDGRIMRCNVQALAVDAIQPGRSPLSRFEAAERRSREYGSDHTNVCRHGDELAASLLLTKLVQPPSSAEAAKPCGRARVSGCQLQWRSKGGF